MTAKNKFIVVGENIHCTRSFKTTGKMISKNEQGVPGISFTLNGAARFLKFPSAITDSSDWEAGKAKHCAAAIWQAIYGSDSDRDDGKAYIQSLALRQKAASANYLDINVDEFSTDTEERKKIIDWIIKTAQSAVSLPICVDSSNQAILEAGLSACNHANGKPMLNSVSLEREDAIKLAAQFNAVVIASAAGRQGLPASLEERMQNIAEITAILREHNFADKDIHIDPLVFPIATDGNSGVMFLETVREIRKVYGADIHIVPGISNVSFGMPNRNLINKVFAKLSVDAGSDGGIVDPEHINEKILREINTNSVAYKLTEALLLGKDEYGMEFITASREGKL